MRSQGGDKARAVVVAGAFACGKEDARVGRGGDDLSVAKVLLQESPSRGIKRTRPLGCASESEPMISPLVEEPDWELALRAAPLWEPPRMHTVVVSPHPDDETLGAGGLIARLRGAGVHVAVFAVTDGENAYRDMQGNAEAGQALVREQEQTAALARLGVGVEGILRLRLPDSGLDKCVEEVAARLRGIVTKDTHVVTPWEGDFHPDHIACARASATVALETGARLSSYFFWTWHRGEADVLRGLPVVKLMLRADEWRAKQEALLCHASQLHHPGGEPILPENLLGPARRGYEVFLPR